MANWCFRTRYIQTEIKCFFDRGFLGADWAIRDRLARKRRMFTNTWSKGGPQTRTPMKLTGRPATNSASHPPSTTPRIHKILRNSPLTVRLRNTGLGLLFCRAKEKRVGPKMKPWKVSYGVFLWFFFFFYGSYQDACLIGCIIRLGQRLFATLERRWLLSRVSIRKDFWVVTGDAPVAISYILGSFSIDDGNSSENVSFKMNSRFFNVCRVYSSLVKMANVGEFPWSWFLEERTQV